MPDWMGDGDVAFPFLGLYFHNMPSSITIFGFRIAFYGIIIGIGVLLAFFIVSKLAAKEGISTDLIYDLGIFIVIFGILGARLYYVIFSWDYYKDNLIRILYFREGGLAIYGGVIAGFITLVLFCKKKKVSIFKIGDLVIPGLLIGQILGRYGNFFNREVFGTYSDGLLAMRLPINAVRYSDIDDAIKMHILPGTNYIQVHPTFLYESIYNMGLLLAVMLFRKRKKYDGEVLLWYFGGYGIGRAVIEGIRTDRLLLGSTNIAVSQLLGIILFTVSITIDIFVRISMVSKEKIRTLEASDTALDGVSAAMPDNKDNDVEVSFNDSNETKSMDVGGRKNKRKVKDKMTVQNNDSDNKKE